MHLHTMSNRELRTLAEAHAMLVPEPQRTLFMALLDRVQANDHGRGPGEPQRLYAPVPA